MLTIKKISLAAVSLCLLLVPAAPVFALSAPLPTSRPFQHKEGFTTTALNQTASENWSGYAATSANNTFTSVSSTWIQPTINCSVTRTAYSAYWVGLDGYNDQTVEQIGTEADCNRGRAQYYTWYEMYPQNPTEITTRLAIAPGNKMLASVAYQAAQQNSRGRSSGTGSFVLTLTDTTTKASYSTTQAASKATNRSSAEVITEAPYSNGILPLADFGVMNYATAQVNGLSLGTTPGLEAITMVDPYGMLATPSALDNTQENFTVTWSDPS